MYCLSLPPSLPPEAECVGSRQPYSLDGEPLVSPPSELEYVKQVGQGRKEAVVWQAREVGGAEVAVKVGV